ncbi:diadenosine tetraphosphate hydrolase [Nodosilinea sp. E11]|uniref:HIT family protein n=1 Tax=Nodosilinea sp. E11 TaxID=3037479 RepID=UPI002934D243|nr:diadenosine tetraphosphate hydrolase [Nodosilinea sp. E11]WOD41463.1 diadenosine tetraphosphate hydrolase [Nodosilinea sp. E11]
MTDPGSQLHPDCLACQILAGKETVPGGTIAENSWWVADHCVGPYGLGSVVVKTRAHRENLWDLSEAESASMGPFLQQMSEAIALAMGAERVYVSLWVDQPPYHVHFVLQPRYPDGQHPQELGLKGLELQVFRTLGKAPSDTDMAQAAEQIRTVWQQKFAQQLACES